MSAAGFTPDLNRLEAAKHTLCGILALASAVAEGLRDSADAVAFWEMTCRIEQLAAYALSSIGDESASPESLREEQVSLYGRHARNAPGGTSGSAQ